MVQASKGDICGVFAFLVMPILIACYPFRTLFAPQKGPCVFTEREVPSVEKVFGPDGPYSEAIDIQKQLAYFDLNGDKKLDLEEMFTAAQLVDCFAADWLTCRQQVAASVVILGYMTTGWPILSVDLSDTGIASMHKFFPKDMKLDADYWTTTKFDKADENDDGLLDLDEIHRLLDSGGDSKIGVQHMYNILISIKVLNKEQKNGLSREDIGALLDGTFLIQHATHYHNQTCGGKAQAIPTMPLSDEL